MISPTFSIPALLFLILFSVLPKPALVASPLPQVRTTMIVAEKKKADDDYIPWVPSYRLTWDDFLCAPQHNSDAVASTSTALGIAYQIKGGKLTYQITCRFSKHKSWGLVKTPYILAHEQGHFDITEIFARKLYQTLLNYHLNRATFPNDINTIYDTIVQAKEAFQAAYDGQTDHSRNKRKQDEWLERINNLLEDTQPYANYP
jgi:Bacterial protein of unknown function (DUF922)